MQTGLVLEGGAMRGMYTAGVLDVFMEEGIRLDATVGVSAGAIFGVNYFSGQQGRVIRYSRRFNRDPRYMGVLPLLFTGNLFSAGYAYGTVPRKLDPFDDAAFIRDGRPFWAVVTDVDTGKPCYFPVDSVFARMDLLRASASMPFVSRPVELEGRKYLDGGISDPIPWEFMRGQGYDRLVVVLTREKGFARDPLPGWLIRARYGHRPALAARMAAQHADYDACLQRLEDAADRGEAFLIRPSASITIHRTETDPEKLQGVYDLGVRDARAQLAALRRFLNGGEKEEADVGTI